MQVTLQETLQWLPCHVCGVTGSAGLVGPVSIYCNLMR